MDGRFNDKLVARMILEKIDIGLRIKSDSKMSLDEKFMQLATDDLDFVEADSSDIGSAAFIISYTDNKKENTQAVTLHFRVKGVLRTFKTLFPDIRSEISEKISQHGDTLSGEKSELLDSLETLKDSFDEVVGMKVLRGCVRLYPNLLKSLVLITSAGESMSVASQITDQLMQRNS